MDCNRKKWIVTALLCLSCTLTQAQSLGQLVQQLTLDIQKLSELKTILKDMYQGYEIVDKGYTGIRDIVRDNFSLHKVFLDGLLVVSPTVRQYHRVGTIMDMERSLISEYQSAGRVWSGSGVFTPEELNSISQVYGTLAARANKYLDRLTMVLTDEQLRMSDGERLKTIDGIYTDAANDLQGLRMYNDRLSIQALQRAKELNSINFLETVYGQHP